MQSMFALLLWSSLLNNKLLNWNLQKSKSKRLTYLDLFIRAVEYTLLPPSHSKEIKSSINIALHESQLLDNLFKTN